MDHILIMILKFATMYRI